MPIKIILTSNINTDVYKIDDKEIVNKDLLSFVDKQGANCEIKVLANGLSITRNMPNYKLELSLLINEAICKVISQEGELQLNAKIVDFNFNDDILVMRYLIEDQMHKIEIIYRG